MVDKKVADCPYLRQLNSDITKLPMQHSSSVLLPG